MDHIGGILDRIANIVGKLSVYHLDHDITGVIVALPHDFFSILYLVQFLNRKEYLFNHLAPPAAGNLFVKVFFDLALFSADNPQHVPLGLLLCSLIFHQANNE